MSVNTITVIVHTKYVPFEVSLPPAIVGAILFSGALSFSTYQFLRHRCWFLFPLMAGAFFQCLGFILTAVFAGDPTTRNWVVYTLAGDFTLLGSACLLLAAFVTFSRLVWWAAPHDQRTFRSLWIPPRLISAFFSVSVAMSTLIQFLGVDIYRSSYDPDIEPDKSRMRLYVGSTLAAAGAIIQLSYLLYFILISARFAQISRSWAGTFADGRPQMLFWGICGAILMMLIQTVYRVVQYSDGLSASESEFLVQHEKNSAASKAWPFWVGDALPSFAFLVIFNLTPLYPGAVLPGRYTGFRLRKAELIAAKFAEEKLGSSFA